MKEPLTSYMKTGIVHFMAYPEAAKGDSQVVDLLERFARDAFFGAVEITHIRDPKDRKSARRILESSGLSVGYGAHPVIFSNKLDLNHVDDVVRRQAIDRIKSCVDEAYELGAESIVILSGKHPGVSGKEEAISRLVDSIREICAYVQSIGDMKVLLEPFDMEIEKCALIGTASDAARVAHAVRRDFLNFGLLVDMGHLPLIGESAYKTMQTLKDYVMHVHIGNCVMKDKSHPSYGDQHPRFGILEGENGIDELTDFLEVLFEIGYLGSNSGTLPIVSFEVKPIPGETLELTIAHSKRALVEAWSRVAR